MVISNIDTTSDQVKPHFQKVWVDYDYFCKAANNISDYNKRVLKCRGRWNINRNNEIELHSVSDADRAKYGILIDNNKIIGMVSLIKKQEAEKKATRYKQTIDENRALDVYCDMSLAIDSDFPKYFNIIKQKYPLIKSDKCQVYAKRWAAMEWVVANYKPFKMCLETFYGAWSRIFPDQFKQNSKTGKYSWKNFHKQCVDNGIEHVIVNQKSVKKVATRRSDFQMKFLAVLYIQDRKVIVAEAYRKLAAACAAITDTVEKPMSEANVKIIFREFRNNPEMFAARYGATLAQKELPYNTLMPAEHRNSQWQQDGWTMPFWGAEFQRYTLYLVRDNHSRKIVGYSVGKSENTTMILEAMDDAMSNTGLFPYELVSDKHSFHKTQIAARLKAETERMGATWTTTINAQRNQLAERYNQHLDAQCKEFTGYLGKNITAKGKDAHLSDEARAELSKTRNFKTEAEIKAIAAHVVAEFNKLPLKVLNGLSPNEKYAASEDKHAFAISETDRINLIRPVEAYKVIRGQITIKIGGIKHEFQLNAQLISKYNNRKLMVAYEDLLQGIYIYDPNTGEALGDVQPKRKVHGALADQTETDKRIFNQQTGRMKGTKTKGGKKLEQIMDGLAANPEAIALINTYALPKEIRQVAQQSAELKRAMADKGINENMLPIRKEDVIAPVVPSKTKDRPFTPINNVMKRFDPYDNIPEYNE